MINQNSLDLYPTFKSIQSTHDAFTIDERDIAEQTKSNNKTVKKVKSSNSSVRCDICSVSISSQIVYDVHIQGRKHQMQLKATLHTNPEYQTPTYDELCSKKQTNEIVNNSLEQTDSIVNKSLKITCDLCRVTCNSQQMFNTHVAGKRHQTKLREGVFPMTDQSPQMNLECQLCQKKFREQIHLTRHFDSASHRDRLSKSYNPFYATNNSTYPDSDEQINSSKRRRIYPSNQTYPLPDYIPISSHYSY